MSYTRPFSSFFLLVLSAGFGFMLAVRAAAQTYTVLHSFTNNPDGMTPYADLVLYGSTLYGTTQYGGVKDNGGWGTVFKVNIDGTGETILKRFDYLNNFSDGLKPQSGLVLSGNVLYGMTTGGGLGYGTVFSMGTDGMSYTNLHTFSRPNDGESPSAGLVLSGNKLYGTTYFGPNVNNGNGTIFSMNTDGTGYTNLHIFTSIDGAHPAAALISSNSVLYGTTSMGGIGGDSGTVFSMNTDGTSFTNLHQFDFSGVGSPLERLVLSGDTLYGTTHGNGTHGAGAIFKVNTDGTGFTNIVEFTSGGLVPSTGLTLLGNKLYGAAGGPGGGGVVFRLNTNGMGFTEIHSLDGVSQRGLILSGSTLFGTTQSGGTASDGTVFKLDLPITLFFQNTGSTSVFTWNDPSFTLQSGLDVTGVYTNIPGAASPYTNAIAGPQQFFRLLLSD